LADTIKPARDAAIHRLARDLRINRDEAERWCVAWEQFARRRGGVGSQYFWDAGRGWIDAQRAMGKVLASAKRLPDHAVEKPRAAVAAVRRVDQAS
jgi:hypothetical protein